jgi:hypothetical protein
MALRKVRKFIQDRQGTVSRRLEQNVLEGETGDSGIDAATVIIDSALFVNERLSLRDDFVSDIRKMSERGDTIIAMVVALE